MADSVFPTRKLGELCSKIGSGATPRGGSKVYLDFGEVSLIRSQNVRNDRFDQNGLVYIERRHAKQLDSVEVAYGDVLLNITGDSVARCCQVDASILPARVNQHVAIVRPLAEQLDASFLRYFLISPEMQNHMLAWAGSGGTRNALTKGMIEEFSVPVPPLPEQKAIAHVLGSLDDKIELNRQMNATLEAMAQALFKSWFIDFDPVLENAILAGNPVPDEFAERAEMRRQILDQNQPSPPAPLPEVEGSSTQSTSPLGRSGDEGSAKHFRGGFDFSGMVQTARELRQKQTAAEDVMWELLRNRQFMGLKFRRQHQIGEYIADFYCHEARLVIELDGNIHEQKAAKDKKRDAYMQAIGLTVLRFTNDQFLSDPESVLQTILKAASIKSNLPYASEIGKDEGLPGNNLPSTSGRGAGGEGLPEHLLQLFPATFTHTEELGWIPEGWEAQKAAEFLQINPSIKLKKETVATYADMASLPTEGFTVAELVTKPYNGGAKFQNGDVLLARITPCLENGKTAVVDFLEGEEVGFGSTEFIVLRGRGKIRTPLIACLARNETFRQHCIASMVGSSGRQRVQNACFDNFFLALPTDTSLLTAFNNLTDPSFRKITHNARANRDLAKTRDTLLPKLLNGELRLDSIP